ncbi:unnamed protein product, partial [Brassica oleracea]
ETHAPPAKPSPRRSRRSRPPSVRHREAAAASPVTFLIWSPFEQLEFIITSSYCF